MTIKMALQIMKHNPMGTFGFLFFIFEQVITSQHDFGLSKPARVKTK